MIYEWTTNSKANSYGYDLYGKLESATLGSDQYAYYYDLFGNITAITRIEDYTISRRNLVYDTTSGWRDRLVSVNGIIDEPPGSYLNCYKTNFAPLKQTYSNT